MTTIISHARPSFRIIHHRFCNLCNICILKRNRVYGCECTFTVIRCQIAMEKIKAYRLPKSKRVSKEKIPKNKRPKPFPIVGFGASAGGIQAFATVLRNLDPNLGMAYVLIMHLSPNHKSALAEIMQSKTKMPVQTVKNGME